MVSAWPVQDAKARFSELLRATLDEGPQIVTKHGVETAVLVRIDDWKNLQGRARPSLKELLMYPGARTENLVPDRTNRRHRTPPAFE